MKWVGDRGRHLKYQLVLDSTTTDILNISLKFGRIRERVHKHSRTCCTYYFSVIHCRRFVYHGFMMINNSMILTLSWGNVGKCHRWWLGSQQAKKIKFMPRGGLGVGIAFTSNQYRTFGSRFPKRPWPLATEDKRTAVLCGAIEEGECDNRRLSKLITLCVEAAHHSIVCVCLCVR